MTFFRRLLVLPVLFCVLIATAVPCGPGWFVPLFDIKSAPEHPFEDFAAGKLGIIKPTMHRSVLFVAYRYINGGAFSPAEQNAVIKVWNADFHNDGGTENSVDDALDAWIAARKDVVGKEEKPPQIYADRENGGYSFFPNCTKNAFETATATLKSRAAAYGSSSREVRSWIDAQDEVFRNCSEGKRIPRPADQTMPQWLQKDRAYQVAAAQFYAMDYNDARRGFAQIAADGESPWRETADYLVARTLIRQASLAKDARSVLPLYQEAETRLMRFTSSGEYSDSANKMIALIKYRVRPRERVQELGRTLMQPSGEQIGQDLIDYTWLLDKFETEAYREAEAKKKGIDPNAAEDEPQLPNDRKKAVKLFDDDLEIDIYNDDFSQNWSFAVRADATDEDAIAEAEKVVGSVLSADMKERVRQARMSAYANRFGAGGHGGYEGGYIDDERSLAVIPQHLRNEPLTDWLFAFQINDADSYRYATEQFENSGSALWLMTALSKADNSSPKLAALLEAAGRAERSSPAYPTIAFHAARLNLNRGKQAEAARFINDILQRKDEQPVSTINQFMALKQRMSVTLDDFLASALRRPYAFDQSGSVGSIADFIKEEKGFYNPQYDKQTREEYEKEVDRRNAPKLLWQNREMFDDETINVFNQHFSQSWLLRTAASPALPEYLRERFALAIWTRAALLNDAATRAKITPELLRYRPEFAEGLAAIDAAADQASRDDAILFFILKNPILTPFIEGGIGKTSNEHDIWSGENWWCEPFDGSYEDGEPVPVKLPARPAFITAADSSKAQNERAHIKEYGDAPKYLADRVLAWAKRKPADRRVPESLYIIFNATGWSKYSCGTDQTLHDAAAALLKTRYASSEWTRKMIKEEQENQ